MQDRGMALQPSVHKQILELAADMGDPIRAGQAVSAIRRSGQQLSATALSRYIIANAKARVCACIPIYHVTCHVMSCDAENWNSSGAV